MIIEYSKNGVKITHNTLEDKIADEEYYLFVAKMYGSTKSLQRHKRKLKQLKEELENQNKIISLQN